MLRYFCLSVILISSSHVGQASTVQLLYVKMFFRYYFFFASSVISHSPLPGIDYLVMVDVDVEVPLKIEIW